MLDTEITERRLVEQFLEALRALPEVRAELEPGQPRGPEPDRGYDAQVGLWVAGKPVTVLIEARKALYPRDVRQVLWRLREFSRRWPREPQAHETVLLLIAESISPGAKELLRDEQVGYYDSGGSLFLPARGVYLYVDKPPPKPVSKSMRSLFSKRRAQVLHALLMRHEDWFGVTALAGQARVSPATASQVLRQDFLGGSFEKEIFVQLRRIYLFGPDPTVRRTRIRETPAASRRSWRQRPAREDGRRRTIRWHGTRTEPGSTADRNRTLETCAALRDGPGVSGVRGYEKVRINGAHRCWRDLRRAAERALSARGTFRNRVSIFSR